jgi:hypothetical protein
VTQEAAAQRLSTELTDTRCAVQLPAALPAPSPEQGAAERAAAKRAAFVAAEMEKKATTEREAQQSTTEDGGGVSSTGHGTRAWPAAPELPIALSLPTKFLSLPLPWVEDDCCVLSPRALPPAAPDPIGEEQGNGEKFYPMLELNKLKDILRRVGEEDGHGARAVSEEELDALRKGIAQVEWVNFSTYVEQDRVRTR